VLLFAYGTLQHPARRAAVIGDATPCGIVATGSVRGVLYDAGEYPVLRPSDAATDRVPGLLLDVDDAALARLDEYEGTASGLYRRERYDVELAGGRVVEAWVYVYAQSVSDLCRIAAWPADRS
jgi:gamma-glutamylcyclotransferase (GGCT)/AIG2-like uncharacterized protein YtfP